MSQLDMMKPERVFKYFREISSVPRGSGDMKKIADYCMGFAEKFSLEAYRDEADNVVIKKPASKGYENAEAVILQGHLDMVCQKTEDCDIDFLNDGLELYVDGDFLKAKGTSLGADNGIAVAMILAVLESDDIAHPAIEAVFTTDEEIGLIGASNLDTSVLKGKRMINIDSEEDDTLTVSCAGGSDFVVEVPVVRNKVNGCEVVLTIKGLKGGHSGVEIHKGRVNANILAGRILSHLKNCCEFELVSLDGGDKGNAITNSCKVCLCVKDRDLFVKEAESYFEVLRNELSARESGMSLEVRVKGEGKLDIIDSELGDKLVYFLACVPDGVLCMSAEIEGLVESSQNLGILKTDGEKVLMHFALRSNKKSGMAFLEEKMKRFSECIPCEVKTFGHYPPWEFMSNSSLQQIYKDCFKEHYGFDAKVEAIHAGLECSVFSAGIEGLDCISIGPTIYDVHTVNEKLSISSTEKTYGLLLKILEKLNK